MKKTTEGGDMWGCLATSHGQVLQLRFDGSEKSEELEMGKSEELTIRDFGP